MNGSCDQRRRDFRAGYKRGYNAGFADGWNASMRAADSDDNGCGCGGGYRADNEYVTGAEIGREAEDQIMEESGEMYGSLEE
ncbi:MAG: hypothetical protein HFG69_13840 [Hungatella sp.]|jgi:hypothetical protein|nr:hypothetical protein [Hungatella sp.]